MERLVFWDIDRTLLTMDGVAVKIFAHALKVSTGRSLEHLPKFAGMTDRYLVAETLAAHGVEPTDAAVEGFFAALVDGAASRDAELRSRGRALPGACAALDALAAQPGLAQSVVTGNLRPIARQKLSAVGLDAHLDLEIGGYGSDSAVRADLVGLALARAAAKHPGLAGRRAVVIGDTPNDVAAARAHGAFSIAVASGGSTMADLRDAGADVVLESLADTAAVLAAASR